MLLNYVYYYIQSLISFLIFQKILEPTMFEPWAPSAWNIITSKQSSCQPLATENDQDISNLYRTIKRVQIDDNKYAKTAFQVRVFQAKKLPEKHGFR